VKRVLLLSLVLLSLFSSLAEPEWMFPEYSENTYYYGISEDGKSTLICNIEKGSTSLFGAYKTEWLIMDTQTRAARPLTYISNAETDEFLMAALPPDMLFKMYESELEAHIENSFRENGYTSWPDAYLGEAGFIPTAVEINGHLALISKDRFYHLVINLSTGEAMALDGIVYLASDDRFLVINQYTLSFDVYRNFHEYERISPELPENEFCRAARLTENGKIVCLTYDSYNRETNLYLYYLSADGSVEEKIDLGVSSYRSRNLYLCANDAAAVYDDSGTVIWYDPDFDSIYSPGITLINDGDEYMYVMSVLPPESTYNPKGSQTYQPIAACGGKLYAYVRNYETGNIDLIAIDTSDFSVTLILTSDDYEILADEKNPGERNRLYASHSIPNGSFINTLHYGPIRFE